jgi:hypothetical protein
MALLLIGEVVAFFYAGAWVGMKWQRAPGLGAFLGMAAACVALGFSMNQLHDLNAALLG